ncbi:MAG TPA: hypothetical protein PLM22_01870 [Candidatus Sabulitectum sp.]|nr:hypothetical protein [Candidatus Sabulitectum sp.]HPJ27651.1 hypothetical protein [Candidatus Sabulitectum sp.]HPR21372.1 hypothetical protein [Candidatus Sabulitectum sp.]
MLPEIPALIGSLAATLPHAELQELFQTEDWNTLRTIWETLNRLPPGNGYGNFPMTAEKGDSMQAALQGLFQDASFENSSIRSALGMTVDLTAARINRLSRMNPMLMTRMMPPWTETVQDGVLFSFEERITTLTDLLEEGELTAGEYAAARDSLLNRAITLTVLEILNAEDRTRLYDYGLYDESSVTVDSILQRLDMSCSAAMDTLAKSTPSQYKDHYRLIVEQHERFLEDYAEFQETLPVFRAVLSELMEAGSD